MAKQATASRTSTTPKKRRDSARPAPALVVTPLATPAPLPSHEAIARRAFELYEMRGGVGGDEMSDWLRAETELATAQI
jgi:DUF2934 family protein